MKSVIVKRVSGFLGMALILGTLLASGELPKAWAGSELRVENPSASVNVNKAGAEELQTLKGIGPAIAQRILDYRAEHGPFKKPEELKQVRGIGEAKFEKIKNQVTV